MFIMSGTDPATADVNKGLFPAMVFTQPVIECLIVGDFEKYGPRGTGEWACQNWDEVSLKYSKGALADSWEISADKLIFHICPGIYWAAYGKEHVMEPREVTADDVAFSLNRYVDDSPAVGIPGWLKTENGGWVDSIYATDDTVVVETSSFSAFWKDQLISGWCTSIYPPEVVAADLSDWNNLVGTGPFMVKEYIPGSAMVYERNPNYWGTATINGKEYDDIPFIDTLIYAIVPDESTQISALRTGDIDIVWSVLPRYEETLAQTSPELVKKRVLDKPVVIALNMHSEILDEKDVRRALMIATDRETINKAVYGPGGDWNTFPIASLVPDVYTPIDELPASARELLVYDPVKAKQMLADAGYPDGFSLKMILSAANLSYIDVASMAKEHWAAIGVTLNLEILEATAFTRLLWGSGAAGAVGTGAPVDYDCMIQSDAPHNAPFRGLGNSFTASGRNFANFYDEDFTTQYELALSKTDIAEQNAILKKLNVIGLDSAAYIPIGSPSSLRYWWPWVKNYYGEKDCGCFYFGPLIATIWLDQDLKTEMGY
ncbi:Heme-binding protein A [subsurface metagenome]